MLTFETCFPSSFNNTILGLDTLMTSDEVADAKEKILCDTVDFLGVLKSPMKLVTGGNKVKESRG